MIRSSDKKLKILFTLLFALQVLAINMFSQQESLTWLGTLGGNLSQAFAVSDDGSVLVGVFIESSGSYRAFKWTSAKVDFKIWVHSVETNAEQQVYQ